MSPFVPASEINVPVTPGELMVIGSGKGRSFFFNNFMLSVYLHENGWTPADHVKDFGYIIPSLVYVKKQNEENKTWSYLSCVCDHETGDFLEAVLETYVGQKNTRDKGQKPLSVGILRGIDLVNFLFTSNPPANFLCSTRPSKNVKI